MTYWNLPTFIRLSHPLRMRFLIQFSPCSNTLQIAGGGSCFAKHFLQRSQALQIMSIIKTNTIIIWIITDSNYLLGLYWNSQQKGSVKEVFLITSPNSLENTYVRVSILIKSHAWGKMTDQRQKPFWKIPMNATWLKILYQ